MVEIERSARGGGPATAMRVGRRTTRNEREREAIKHGGIVGVLNYVVSGMSKATSKRKVAESTRLSDQGEYAA